MVPAGPERKVLGKLYPLSADAPLADLLRERAPELEDLIVSGSSQVPGLGFLDPARFAGD